MAKQNEVIIYQGPPLIYQEKAAAEKYGIIATEGHYKNGVITVQDYFLRDDGTRDINGEIDLSKEMIKKLYVEYCFEK